MKIIRNDEILFKLHHIKLHVVWTTILFVCLFSLCVMVDVTYPRMTLTCIRHPSDTAVNRNLFSPTYSDQLYAAVNERNKGVPHLEHSFIRKLIDKNVAQIHRKRILNNYPPISRSEMNDIDQMNLKKETMHHSTTLDGYKKIDSSPSPVAQSNAIDTMRQLVDATEDVDCVLDRWKWSLRPVRDGYLVSHEVDDFELSNVTVEIKYRLVFPTGKYRPLTSTPPRTKTKDSDKPLNSTQPTSLRPFNRTERQILVEPLEQENSKQRRILYYTVLLWSHSPARKIEMGSYIDATTAYSMADRVQTFLQQATTTQSNLLTLYIDQDDSWWVELSIFGSFLLAVFCAWRAATETIVIHRRRGTLTIVRRNLLGYPRSSLSSTLDNVCRARVHTAHVYAMGGRFDFRMQEHAEYIVQILVNDQFGAEDIISVGLGDVFENPSEARKITEAINRWLQAYCATCDGSQAWQPRTIRRENLVSDLHEPQDAPQDASAVPYENQSASQSELQTDQLPFLHEAGQSSTGTSAMDYIYKCAQNIQDPKSNIHGTQYRSMNQREGHAHLQGAQIPQWDRYQDTPETIDTNDEHHRLLSYPSSSSASDDLTQPENVDRLNKQRINGLDAAGLCADHHQTVRLSQIGSDNVAPQTFAQMPHTGTATNKTANLNTQEEIGPTVDMHTQAASETFRSCAVCQSTVSQVVLLPCRHLCLCARCAQSVDRMQLTRCPVCRHVIDALLPIYT